MGRFVQSEKRARDNFLPNRLEEERTNCTRALIFNWMTAFFGLFQMPPLITAQVL
jgi:hypothetical protein